MIPLLMASAVASAQNVSIFDPASPPAESIRSLSVLVLAITAFIFVVVEGILLYSIFRFRRGCPHPHPLSRGPSDETGAAAGEGTGARGDRRSIPQNQEEVAIIRTDSGQTQPE